MIKIFVYGTLKEGFKLDGSCAEIRESVVKNAKAKGTLFNLGPFPGAKFDTQDTIIGELHEFSNDLEALRVIDNIEGYYPDNKENSLFLRKLIDVSYQNNEKIKAYAYEFNFDRYEVRQTKIKTGVWEEN